MPRPVRSIVLAVVLALAAPWFAPCLVGAADHGRMPCCPSPGRSESPAVSACCGPDGGSSTLALPEAVRAAGVAAFAQAPAVFGAAVVESGPPPHAAPVLTADVRLLASVFLI
jgi:hypothetical protein